MKRLILQVDIKIDDHTGYKRYEPVEELYKISEHQARLFADKWKVDYFKITDCNFLPNKHPIYQRLKMYELDYDQILYLDMDAVILHCEQIGFEVELAATLLTPPIKAKISEEAQSMNLIKKVNQLPL